MRKILITLLCILVLTLQFAGCSKKNEEPETSTPAEQSNEDNSEKEKANEKTEVKHIDYPQPQGINTQASFDSLSYKDGDKIRIAYMPPATEFNYYMAIGEGIKSLGKDLNIETFMLAPQSGADINGQMSMLQDVINQDVHAIILSTHDENAAAPLVKQAVEKGIEVIIVNSDFPQFSTDIHAVVGYSQFKAQKAIGEYAVELMKDKDVKVGIIEGQPGYHATERTNGFLAGIEGADNFEVVSSLDGKWNVEGGNQAAMDMLQANPEINLIVANNDYEIMGAQKAVAALNSTDIVLLGNDGDTACLEEIAAGNIKATANTTPFVMGQIALQVAYDGLMGEFQGGFIETPSVVTDETNVLEFLQDPDSLYPKPSKSY